MLSTNIILGIKYLRFSAFRENQLALVLLSTLIISTNTSNICRIKEHAPINSVVCSITNRFSTESKPNLYLISYKNLFKINPLNQIVVINSIDRESLNPINCVPGPDDTAPPYCRLVLEIVNKTRPKDFQIFQLPIDIEDINDNSPIFDKLSYNIEIDENIQSGHIQQLPVARDSDYGINSEIIYSIEGKDKNYFSLLQMKNNKPILKTMKLFDREERDRYELVFIATDKGIPKKTGEIKIYIKIRDLNDHAPEFDMPKDYIIGVKEDAIEGSKICDIKVTDKDDETLITVLINSNSDPEVKRHFQVSAISGLTLISRLDYESSIRKFTIPIIAVDNGIPNLTTSTTIIVNVLDINDNYPQIVIDTLSDSSSNFKLMENRPKESFVAMVTVTDADSEMNGIVDCNIIEPNNKQNFELISRYFNNFPNSKRNYRIVTLREFDRETISHYRVTVQCKDQGLPSLSSQQTITIWIEDENDNPPSFSKFFFQDRIKENIMPGSPIFTLVATDPDIGKNAKIIYQIPEKYQNIISIPNPSTGIVTNLVSFDREMNTSITFKAYALDEFNPLLNSSVEITLEIEDENDCIPIFLSGAYHFKIKEGHSGWVGKVEAYDNDSNSNSDITFSFTGFLHNHLWILKSDGNIFSERGIQLDREVQSTYQLTVEAKDNGVPSRSSSVIVQIQLEDINDNSPKFSQPLDSGYMKKITESLVPGTLITKVMATDEDENENGKVTYLIANNKYFIIDEKSGEVFINRTLDRIELVPRRLLIMAKDNGTPSFTTTATLQLLFQNEDEDKQTSVINEKVDQEKTYQEARRKNNVDNYDGFKWNSKEVLISLTVGSVMLIISCGGLLLIYIWYQTRSPGEMAKRNETDMVLTEQAASSPVDEEPEESSCIQCLCLNSKNRSIKEFLYKTDDSSSQQQKQGISQSYIKQQRIEKNDESNIQQNSNFPLMWKYDNKYNELYPFPELPESNFFFKSCSNKQMNIYEPPLKQMKSKSPMISMRNYSTVQIPSYNINNDASSTTTAASSALIYNHSKYETTLSQTDRPNPALVQTNYPVSCFAVPNPKINNSFV